MWHEARKQEKKIRCMLVDYQRRAQRRKDYYDRIKADPTQFLQLHGRPCKIHLDPAVCIAANSSVTMMPWQGNTNIMIDRFDVRAHLDFIPDISSSNKTEEDLSYKERQINYERYRILVQNDFFNIAEDKFLHQINLEEKFGPLLKNVEESNSSKRKATAAIGYNYDETDSFQITSNSSTGKLDDVGKNVSSVPALNVEINDENDSESDIDLDLTVDVSKIETQQANELNSCAHAFGMLTNDFFSFLNNDLEEAENMRIVKEQEEEKAMFSGRKSRKERRAFRERTLIGRKLSPPSYAWRKSPSYEDYKALVSSNRSRSKSTSPLNSGKITYITSFGGDEPLASSSTITNKSNSSFSSTSQKDSSRKRFRSRSRSKEKERSKRSRRSRSGSGSYKKKSSTHKILNSKSRSRSQSKSGYDSKYKVRNQDTDSKVDKRFRKRSLSRSRSRSEHRFGTSRESPRNISDSVPLASGSDIGVGFEQTAIPRYYGRRKDDSSSELSLSSEDESSKQSQTSKSKLNQIPASIHSSSASNKITSSDCKLTPQERLRRKRQVLLNKQFKADKRAEREKVLKMVQERIDRAEEMKEISIKLRRRQRMLRHNDSPRRHSSGSRSSSLDDRSASRSPCSRRHHKRSDKHRSRSLSTDDSDDSTRNERRRSYKKYKNSASRSRSRSPRRNHRSEDNDSKKINKKERDKGSRSRRYCTLSEENELARVQLEGKIDNSDGREDSRSDYRPRRDRSPKNKFGDNANFSESTDERRERIYESDRYRTSRSSFSRRSSSRDRQMTRFDY